MEVPGDYGSVAGHLQSPLAYGTRDFCSTQRPAALQVAITPSHWPGVPPQPPFLGNPPTCVSHRSPLRGMGVLVPL